MKIVMLSRLYHPHIGGVEKHVEKLSMALISKGHAVTVLTSQYESSLNLTDSINGISISRIPHNDLSSKLAVWDWIAAHKNQLQDADVIHAHDVTWWLWLQKLTLQKPIFTTFHGWEGVFPPTWKSKLSRTFSAKISKGTINVGDFISKWYGTKPDYVTYGATGVTALPVGNKDKILVFGRLSHDNDLPLVINGLKLIKQKFPHIKVTFLGDGNFAWEAEKVGRVLGFQENPDRFISQSYWVISSSYLAILDAMAAGRNVMSVYSNPLKKDYLTMHPMAKCLSSAASPEQLMQNFSTLYLDTKKANSQIIIGQKWALEQTWENLANTYLQLWSKDYKVASHQLQTSL